MSEKLYGTYYSADCIFMFMYFTKKYDLVQLSIMQILNASCTYKNTEIDIKLYVNQS